MVTKTRIVNLDIKKIYTYINIFNIKIFKSIGQINDLSFLGLIEAFNQSELACSQINRF